MKLNIVILAAGRGTRMKSRLPKVLHQVGGLPILEHILRTASSVDPAALLVVHGDDGDQLKERFSQYDPLWVHQKEQLGTGHAVLQALPYLDDDERLLILLGDGPLIQKKTLQLLIDATTEDGIGMVTALFEDPTGLGRVVRNDDGEITNIVEEKDLQLHQKAIPEINPGIILAPVKKLKSWLSAVDNNNTQQEYYLPDVIKLAVAEGYSISHVLAEEEEVQGVNSKDQLAMVETYYQEYQAYGFMENGITMRDPGRVDFRGDCTIEPDVTIDTNVILHNVTIKSGAYIGPYSFIKDSVIGEDVKVQSHSHIEGAKIGRETVVGPFARLRPGTELAEEVRIGNFVEIKKSTINKDTKVNHLSYIGDTNVGESVNIGAGTITCNYDGKNKYQTTIKDNVFIGSGTELVAPVTLAEGSTIGAGSTITQDTQPNTLALTRADLKTITPWPTKNREKQ